MISLNLHPELPYDVEKITHMQSFSTKFLKNQWQEDWFNLLSRFFYTVRFNEPNIQIDRLNGC